MDGVQGRTQQGSGKRSVCSGEAMKLQFGNCKGFLTVGQSFGLYKFLHGFQIKIRVGLPYRLAFRIALKLMKKFEKGERWEQ